MIRALDTKFLIEENGEEMVLNQKSFSGYDPATGGIASTTNKVNIIAYQGSYDLAEVDGTMVIRGDRKVVMPSTDVNGEDFEPDVDDTVEATGDKTTIVSVSKIMSAGNVLCYVCQVRE